MPLKGRGSWSNDSKMDEPGVKVPRVPVTGRARLAVLHARRSDDPEKEKVLHRARYLRVVEALPTSVTSSSHTSLATRILGVAPIHADGSAYCEVPSNTALFLEPLDAAGHRLEYTWRHPVTSVPRGSRQILQEMTYITTQTGEVKACNGCHAPQEEATAQIGTGRAQALARPPVQLQRDSTDIVYRRNEPDEYRCQARIGEAARYRPWLVGSHAELRRRACELLMQMDDEARQDAAKIAKLLTDEESSVRRAAALALTRLGTLAQATALWKSLSDPDWQVQFHAASALEAITACRPNVPVTAKQRAEYYGRLVEPAALARLTVALGQGPAALRDFADQRDPDLTLRWYEAIGRYGRDAPRAARRKLQQALAVPVPPPVTFQAMVGKRHPLEAHPPELAAIRAAGWMGDPEHVPLLIPWLARHEYQDHATEAAVALGRIGTPTAVNALWEAVRLEVPNKTPFQRRYLQHGPRPEEYALLRGLILAGSAPAIDDVHLIIALLPGTFLEKPRYEDRLRRESQRVLLGRLLLQNAGLRKPAVELLVSVLRGDVLPAKSPLYEQILKGINLERPFAEHRRPFPVVEYVEAEQALWLLSCLSSEQDEVPEATVAGYLTSDHWRERIDAAVLLDVSGFGSQTARILAAQVREPYSFKEIMGIGKSHYDENFRDKCYLVMTLAHHAEDVQALYAFADPRDFYRDIRYGLATGLGKRGRTDGIDLLLRIATSDPIASIRRQARISLRRIQEAEQRAGRPVPRICLPEAKPFEVWYPPRQLRWPGPRLISRQWQPESVISSFEAARQSVLERLSKEYYRDLNNANNQAPGAKRMMVEGIAEFEHAVSLLSMKYASQMGPTLEELLVSPYPYAHYLAIKAARRDTNALSTELLLTRLESFSKSVDTVGFHWICDLLARRSAEQAVDQLVLYAELEDPPGIHGPAGLGLGYPAAKAVGRLCGATEAPPVQRLLNSANDWVRAGVLAGLTEARAPGIKPLLEKLLTTHQPALIRDHARVGLQRLTITALHTARPTERSGDD
jgi:HEAT repeat protein